MNNREFERLYDNHDEAYEERTPKRKKKGAGTALLVVLCMMFSAAFWPRFLQKLLDNRLMRFLSVISMNLYIWHQVLAVQMRIAWFPAINLLHTDPNLQFAYMLLCAAVAVLAAMTVTFGLEQPATRWLNKRFAPK